MSTEISPISLGSYYDNIYYGLYNPTSSTLSWKERLLNVKDKIDKLKKFDGSGFVKGINKVNDFLTNDKNGKGYGSAINKGLDIVGGLIKEPPGYSGRYGSLLLGIDKTWDSASDALMAIPGYGTALGMGMKALGVLNKGIQRLGGGTDGMTKTDAWLSSSLLGWTPLGMINGFGGKKANTYTRNQELDALSASGFGGFLSLQNTTALGAGKKYGLFSSGARDKLNLLTEYTQGVKHTVSGIVDFNTLNNMASMGTTLFAAQQLNIDLNGGIHNLRAARQGLKLKPIKLPKFKQKYYDPEGMTVDKDKWEETYVDGKRYFIKANLTYYGGDPIPTKDGDLLYKKSNGKIIKYPYHSALFAKRGGQFVQNVLNKYQLGNSLKRTVQVFDVASNKYVLIPIPLSKDLVAGRIPIRLANGTAVFMNGDGTVTSDRWETIGRREHLTPKGLNGMKTPQHKNGGKMNVIPEGALHARKNHLTDVDNIYKLVTHKGIPIITIEDNGEVVQHAEVEHSEIIFTKEVTDLIEKYREEGTDEAALACGKLLVKEILYNTDDRSGVMQTVE